MRIYVKIAVDISEDVNPDEVVSEMDYKLEHKNIVNTEVIGYEEKA